MVSDLAVIFLDANILARPITRTLLMVTARDANLAVTWSAYVEAEAERHLRGHAVSVGALRARHELELGPTGVSQAHLVAGCRTVFALRYKRRRCRGTKERTPQR